MCRFGSTAALFAIAASAALIPHSGQAVCMWADVGGHRLGVVGQTTGGYSTALSTLDRTVSFDTQVDGKAIFFGYVANKVKLSRASHGDKPYVYEFGTVAREMTGGGWTKHGDLSGKHTYQPSWMLMQTPLITRIYACQPHKGGAGDFRMAGGQGAEWSTNPRPWIHDVQFYRDTNTRLEVTGYGVVYGGVNRNYVTLIDVDERWPCEILKDFSVPTGITAISSRENREVAIHWDTVWGCGRADGGPEKNHDLAANRAPTVSLKAVPDRGEPTLNTTFTAAAKDPDGDEVEYRFRLPGGQWTPWGPNPSVTDQFSKVGTYTAEVQAMDINENLSDIVKVKVTVENPAWDALVLSRWKTNLWQSHVRGWSGFSEAHENQMADTKWAKEAEAARARSLLREVKDGGSLIGHVDFKFMKGASQDMAVWLARNHSLYVDLLRKAHWRDAVVVLSRLDPDTGKREYKAGLWDNFTDREGWPLGDSRTYGVDPLKTKWQSSDNKSLRVGGVAHRVNVVGYQYSATPVILDMSGKGHPDLLAGSHAWRKDREGSPAEHAFRDFDLDGTGTKAWEWVGPTAGILVWGGDRAGPVKADRLFGNRTWGKHWADGYRPLEALDKDGDGWLKKEESKDVYIWVDANSNATNEPGEIKSLSDHGVVEIAVGAERDGEGNAWVQEGFRRVDGSTGRSWDWWSRSSASPVNNAASTPGDKVPAGDDNGIELVDESPSVYSWAPTVRDPEIPGGALMFSKIKGGGLFLSSFVPFREGITADGDSSALIGISFQVEREGDSLMWKTSNGDVVIKTTAVIKGSEIRGTTETLKSGQSIKKYSWEAEHETGPTLAQVE